MRCLCCGLSCCCDCLSCFRGRGRKRARYADSHSPFKSAPYQGYQPANNPHEYAPPQYAHFDANRNRNAKVNEDSLPAMPSWSNARDRKVLDESNADDVEMGQMDPQRAPMLAHKSPNPTTKHSGTGPPTAGLPYEQHGATQGGDLGNPYGQGSAGYDGTYGHASPTAPQQYQSPGGLTPYHGSPAQQAYPAYAPSMSTRYEPSSINGGQVYGGQEMGTAYRSPSPYGNAPSVLQAGRQPPSNSFRDV